MKETITKLLTVMALLAMLAAVGCDDDEPNVQEPIDQLPPLTTTGENTFGCLLNGRPLVASNTLETGAIYQGGFLQLGGMKMIREMKECFLK